MATVLDEIQQDSLALAVARAVALANESARAHGLDLANSLMTVTEDSPPPQRLWRIHYGSRDYVNRRGGDLIVYVDEQAGAVRRVIRGQ